MSNYVSNNRGNFHLQLLRRFKDIAFSVVGSFSLPHPVEYGIPGLSVVIKSFHSGSGSSCSISGKSKAIATIRSISDHRGNLKTSYRRTDGMA